MCVPLNLFVKCLLTVVIVGTWMAWDYESGLIRTPDLIFGRHNDGVGSTDRAGNRTLGFSSIKLINMPKRFDYYDAATLHAYLAGLDLEYYPAAELLDFHDAGTPPTSNVLALKPDEKGRWRTHANGRSRDAWLGESHKDKFRVGSKPGQPNASFEEIALQKAWRKIFSTEKTIEIQ
ncbi:hypothetical protein V8F20_007156 [Naviculisporaceae sp. PSN 640]